MESAATDGTNPLTQFLGDGDYRLNGQDLEDAGEQTVTLVGGATGSITIRRKNGWVRVRVDITFTTSSGTLANISGSGSIPAALRPADTESMGAYFSLHPGTIRVTTAGTVQAIQSSGANRGTVLGSIVYPVV